MLRRNGGSDALEGWKLLVGQMADPAWIKLPSLEYCAINQSGAALSGNSPHEMCGGRASQFYGSRIGGRYDDSDRLAMQAGRSIVSIDSGLGEARRWCETVKMPLFAHGKVIAVIGVARAISSLQALLSVLLSAQGQPAIQAAGRVSDCADPAERPWLQGTKELLDANPRSATSISSLAEAAGVHPDHLTRTFRRRYGVSIRDYRKTSRLCWVARALLEHSDSLSNVAAAAGFADQSHKTREFAAAFGLPPKLFREKFAGISSRS